MYWQTLEIPIWWRFVMLLSYVVVWSFLPNREDSGSLRSIIFFSRKTLIIIIILT